MELEDIRKNYRNFNDDKIETLAKSDANKLRPEVIPILMEEIRRRNLSENLIAGIETQLKILTPEELNDYVTLIRNQSCPKCKSKTRKLNAVILTEVVSMILVTHISKHFRIACPDCLTHFKKKANNKTLLLGWWGFPSGIIKTIGALRQNYKMAKLINSEASNDIFHSFVIENIGQIEAYKKEEQNLNRMLLNANHS
jgi:predicted nucleic-acid-binding Zn-ribbon protein